MPDMESIQQDVNSMKSWQGVANHRFNFCKLDEQLITDTI